MTEETTKLIREIIEENTYLTLATTGGADPWAATLQYVADDDLNLYFVSLPTSRHMEHITDHPTVGIAIFDSQQAPFTCRGIQIEGTAEAYSTHDNPFVRIGGVDWPEDLQELVPGYVAVRVEPQRFFLPRFVVDGVLRDERIEIGLS